MQTTYIKKISAFLGMILLTTIMVFPIYTYSQASETDTGTVETDTGITYECNSGAPGDCSFEDLIAGVKKMTNFMVTIALMFSVIVIVYAGYKYMISGDKPAERTAANKMLVSVAKGMAFILAAWLIVSLILRALQVNTSVIF